MADPFEDISTPYGTVPLEDLAATMEITVDYLIHEFLPTSNDPAHQS
jgi:hypothetical protein